MTGLIRLLLIFSALLVVPAANADGDIEAGRIKSETCVGCHGIKGYKNVYPTYKVPMLVGQNKEYLVVALKAYQSGERSHPTMQSQAATMSEQDMADIAAYLSGLGGGDK